MCDAYALVQLQAHYQHCGEAASEKRLSAARSLDDTPRDARVKARGYGVGGQVTGKPYI